MQDKGSKILCEKLGAVKITPSDCLNQEYLTINLGSTSGGADVGQLEQPRGEAGTLDHLLTNSVSHCQFMF